MSAGEERNIIYSVAAEGGELILYMGHHRRKIVSYVHRASRAESTSLYALSEEANHITYVSPGGGGQSHLHVPLGEAKSLCVAKGR